MIKVPFCRFSGSDEDHGYPYTLHRWRCHTFSVPLVAPAFLARGASRRKVGAIRSNGPDDAGHGFAADVDQMFVGLLQHFVLELQPLEWDAAGVIFDEHGISSD